LHVHRTRCDTISFLLHNLFYYIYSATEPRKVSFVGLFRHIQVSCHIYRSLSHLQVSFVRLFRHIRVSFHICRSPFIFTGLFHIYRSLFTFAGLCFDTFSGFLLHLQVFFAPIENKMSYHEYTQLVTVIIRLLQNISLFCRI